MHNQGLFFLAAVVRVDAAGPNTVRGKNAAVTALQLLLFWS